MNRNRKLVDENGSIRKRVSFEEVNDDSSSISATPSARSIPPKNENYENIVLYYFTKLRNLFAYSRDNHMINENCSAGSQVSRVNLDQGEEPKSEIFNISTPKRLKYKYISPTFEDESHELNMPTRQRKVYNIVNAAIEYGLAHNIIERKENVFWLKKSPAQKIAERQLTPGPDTKINKRKAAFRCRKTCGEYLHSKNNRDSRTKYKNARTKHPKSKCSEHLVSRSRSFDCDVKCSCSACRRKNKK